MLLVHVSTCTITFFHQSAFIRRDNCWTVNTFQRAWGFFFPLIFFAFPLFLWAAVLVSSLSIRNHLEQILTLWQILSGNWVQNEEKTKHLVCLLLSALMNRSYASQLYLTERKLTKDLKYNHAMIIISLRIMYFKGIPTFTSKSMSIHFIDMTKYINISQLKNMMDIIIQNFPIRKISFIL